MEEIKKVLEIQFKGQQSIGDLKKEVAQLKKELDACAAGSEDAAKKSLELTKAENTLKAATKGAITENGKLAQSYNGLSSQMARLKAAQKQIDLSTKAGRKQWKEYAKEINQINDKLKDLDAGNGVFSRNVGNYANSIKSAFTSMGGAVGGVFTSIEAGLKALVSNPWVAALTAILLALQQMAEAIKRNETALNGVRKIGNSFKAVLVTIQRAFDTLVQKVLDSREQINGTFNSFKESIQKFWEWIQPFVQGVKNYYSGVFTALKNIGNFYIDFWDSIITTSIKGAAYVAAAFKALKPDKTFEEALEETKDTWLSGWEEIKNGVKTKINDVKETVVETAKTVVETFKKDYKESKDILDQITDAEKALAEQHIKNTKIIAKNSTEIAELDAKVADKENYSVEEREAALEKSAKLQKENIALQIAEAQERLRIAKLNHSLNADTNADMQEEADLIAEIEQLKVQENNVDRNIASQRKALVQDRIKEAKEILDAEKNAIAEELAVTEKGTNRHLELTKEQLDKEKQIAILDAQDKIKDEEKLRKALLNIDDTYNKKELKAIEQHNLDVAAANNLQAKNDTNDVRLRYGSNSVEFYQAELDAALIFRDNLIRLTNETEEEWKARTLAADQDVLDAEAKLNQKRLKNYVDVSNGIADIMSTVADAWQDSIERQVEQGKISEEEGEKQFENVKALQIAITTIQMLTGIATALSGAFTTKTGPWDIAIAAIQATSIAASGIANIAKIKNTTLGSSASASGVSTTPFQLPNLESYSPEYTQNLTGTNDVQDIGNSVRNAIQNAEIRAYVVESDITGAQKKASKRDSEATW